TLAIGPASPAETGIYQARIIMGGTEILTEPVVISVWPRSALTISPGPVCLMIVLQQSSKL
ncbi:MAG: hypothetical protein JWM59_267, partial [Verrucomicrobiales bacterium]|nr:hypothetical protein [Verrucomicrobiales bacterium]